MPGADAILTTLALIANEWRWLATAWHATIPAICVFAITRRPLQRTVALLMTLPIASVRALAWWSGNPFNDAIFMGCGLGRGRIHRRHHRSGRAWCVD